jgi:hypothetical protein
MRDDDIFMRRYDRYNNYSDMYNYKDKYNYTHENKIIINCIKCLNRLKVPVDKGKIKVVCPVCHTEFVFNPNSIVHTLRQILLEIRAWLRKFRNKTVPAIKHKLKNSFYNNKKNFILTVFIAIAIIFTLIMLISALLNYHGNKPKNIPANPGPVAIFYQI